MAEFNTQCVSKIEQILGASDAALALIPKNMKQFGLETQFQQTKRFTKDKPLRIGTTDQCPYSTKQFLVGLQTNFGCKIEALDFTSHHTPNDPECVAVREIGDYCKDLTYLSLASINGGKTSAS